METIEALGVPIRIWVVVLVLLSEVRGFVLWSSWGVLHPLLGVDQYIHSLGATCYFGLPHMKHLGICIGPMSLHPPHRESSCGPGAASVEAWQLGTF